MATINELKQEILKLKKENEDLKRKIVANNISLCFSDVKVSFKKKKSFKLSGWEKLNFEYDDLNKLFGTFSLNLTLLSNIEIPNETIGVLYSGGYDSTALMIYYLEKGFTVLPILLNFNGNMNKVIQVTCLHQLRKIYNKLLPEYEFSTNFYGDGDTYFAQQKLCNFWVSFLPEHIKLKLSQICIAYNAHDFGTIISDKLETLYNAGMNCLLFNNQSINDIRTTNFYFPKICYPFKTQTHLSNVLIVNDFMNRYSLNLPCTSCETSNIKWKIFKKKDSFKIIFCPCGSCDKCKDETYIGTKVDEYRILDFENLEI